MSQNRAVGASRGLGGTAVLLGVAVLVAGCSAAEVREAIGTGVGAAAGAVIGKQLGGTTGAAVGAIAGGVLGNYLARKLNDEEKAAVAQAAQQAANPQQPTNSPVRWESQDQGTVTASGWVIPTSDVYVSSDGRRCRQVKTTLEKGGTVDEHRSTLCEVPGQGTWTTAGIEHAPARYAARGSSSKTGPRMADGHRG
jgi:surface antigen